MRYTFCIFFFFFGSSICYSQKEDYNWVFGRYGMPIFWSGLEVFDFNTDSFSSTRILDKLMVNYFTNSTLSDKNGNLLLTSNGMQLRDKNLDIIDGGAKINFNNYWLSNELELDNGQKITLGLADPQGMLMLQWPDKDSIIWIAPNYQAFGSIFNSYNKGLFFGVVDISKEKPTVVLKDSLITTDSITSNGITACRHANGRDWWIVVGNHNRSKLYVYLLDPSGLKRVNTIATSLNYIFGFGQSVFSPLGDKFVIQEVIGAFGFLDQGHFSIFDFDRCTGMLSNHRYKPFVGNQFIVGCAISNDGHYLYTSNSSTLHQYDMFANDIMATEKLVAQSDSFKSYYNELTWQENFFTFMQLAPDGKIYGPGGNTLHMHRMEYPEEEGEACTIIQHALYTVNNASTIPNMPFFRLGPEDGSPCDTLGLNNNPIAKFRYEQDTLNHLLIRFTDLSYFRPEKWTWDFGDGTSFDGKKPYWHSFPKNGTYNVCLTVSNENSSNTTCRMITIGTTSTMDNDQLLMDNEKLVSVFPNPTEGDLLVTLSDYVPEHGEVIFYDVQGKEVMKSRVYYGWNNLDLKAFAQGTYLYIVSDKNLKLSEGKVVKI